MANEQPKVASFLTPRHDRVMHVKITAPTRIQGQHVDEGVTAKVDEVTGYDLIHAGKAEKHTLRLPDGK